VNLPVQTVLDRLPRFLRRHKVVRALAALDPVQRIRFNGSAEAFVDLREGELRTVLIGRTFDPEYFRIASAFLRGGGTYFDVGANAGLCSFGLIPCCAGVAYHLFEANPALWPALRRSIAFHRGTRIHLVEAAVGAESGRVFIDAKNPDGDIGQGFISSNHGVETRMLTLDQYIRDAGVARVDFMKMDIEGYELFALEGAREAVAAGKLPVIYFELKRPLVERFGKSVADVLDRFRSLGYRLYHVRDQDFATIRRPRDVTVRGLELAPVEDYPPDLWTDLLALREATA
jgi:FkbM family methyltransferase